MALRGLTGTQHRGKDHLLGTARCQTDKLQTSRSHSYILILAGTFMFLPGFLVGRVGLTVGHRVAHETHVERW